MKIYYITYIDFQHGRLEAFTSKTKATKRHSELKKDEDIEQLYDIEVTRFPISAEGIVKAFEDGADCVPK